MASFVTAARVRCPNQADLASEAKLVVAVNQEDKTVTLDNVDEETGELLENQDEKKVFKFDHVFGMNSSGGEVYAEVGRPLLKTVLEGCNACFAVAGQSGGGKTYTLAGGVLPALSKELFSTPEVVSVDVSYLEVHSEKLMDLLNPDQTPELSIREQPGYGVYVSGLTKLRVSNEPELMKLVDDGEYPRVNPNSSTILTLFVRSHSADGNGDVMGKFQLVEYCAYEVNTQNQLALEAFGNVVSELSSMPDASRRNQIDFQESNLTWLVKDTLGGNCKTAFLGALSPAITCHQQSLAVLRLLHFLIPCKCGPMPNVYPQYNMIKQVNLELQKLKAALEDTLEEEDEDATISKVWIEDKARNGDETAWEFLQKEKFLQELGASEAEKQEADKEKKNMRVKSMRKFKGGDEAPAASKVALDDVADAPIIEEEDTPEESANASASQPATTTTPGWDALMANADPAQLQMAMIMLQQNPENAAAFVESHPMFQSLPADQKEAATQLLSNPELLQAQLAALQQNVEAANAAAAEQQAQNGDAEEADAVVLGTPQKPAQENGNGAPSSALVAAAVTTPGTPGKQLTQLNEQDLTDNSPRAMVHTYSESDRQFGVTSPTTLKQQKRTPKICLDHLGVDVPGDDQLREIFKMFDPNGDGKISLVEFRAVFKDAFENFGAPMEDRDVDRLFAKFDTGAGRKGKANDGFLSYDEFCILVLNRLRQ